MLNKRRPGYGDFGVLANRYNEFRRGVPSEVIDYFYQSLKVFNPTVLDVGCGTGISTRQMIRDGVKLFGVDVDHKMVELARGKSSSTIHYTTAPAKNLPFAKEQFDALTAFSAFHWFSDDDSVAEIKRVLIKKGTFFVVNKNDVGEFKDGYKAVLKNFIAGELPDVKKNYKPSDILFANGFDNVCERTFETKELLTISQAIKYFQTVSLWNLIRQDKKSEALLALEKYCQNKSIHGHVERRLNVVAVIGTKS